MSQQERYAWVMLVVAPVGYAVYLAWIFQMAAGAPLAGVAYQGPMLWTIGGGIVAGIVLGIVAGIFGGMLGGEGSLVVDARDREISRLGEYIGQSFVVIGGVVGLVLAMLGIEQFWIANAIYLCFVLSALLGSIAKIAFYRFGLSA